MSAIGGAGLREVKMEALVGGGIGTLGNEAVEVDVLMLVVGMATVTAAEGVLIEREMGVAIRVDMVPMLTSEEIRVSISMGSAHSIRVSSVGCVESSKGADRRESEGLTHSTDTDSSAVDPCVVSTVTAGTTPIGVAAIVMPTGAIATAVSMATAVPMVTTGAMATAVSMVTTGAMATAVSMVTTGAMATAVSMVTAGAMVTAVSMVTTGAMVTATEAMVTIGTTVTIVFSVLKDVKHSTDSIVSTALTKFSTWECESIAIPSSSFFPSSVLPCQLLKKINQYDHMQARSHGGRGGGGGGGGGVG